ncbi:hypothetical protein ACS0TY_022804 [Phlomoides rotata]
MDSPVFSYINNLSPIQLVKVPSVAQGFPGLNSPPLVFTSPRLDSHSQATFLKRAQFSRPSVAKLPGQLEDGKNSVATVEGHENLDTKLCNRLVAYDEKGSDTNNNVNGLNQSPSGCSEQFLTDIVNVESVDQDLSPDSTIKRSDCNDQSPDAVTCSKEVLVKTDHEHKSRIIEEIDVPPVISKQTEEVHKENALIYLSAAEKDIKQTDGLSNDHCPIIGLELLEDHDLANQDIDSLTENVEARQDVQFEQSFHFPPGSAELGQENENFVEADGTTFTVPVLNKVQGDFKAFQHRGARRRCLQFEDVQHKVISYQHAQNPSDGEEAKSLSLETPSTPTNGDHDDVIHPMLYPGNILNSLIKIPKPSGIGLHLNSIIQAGSCAIINVKAAQEGEFNLLEIDIKHESRASMTADLAMALSPLSVEPSNNSVILNSKANKSTLCNKRMGTETGDGLEEINDLIPKNKRLKSLDSSDGDGCKRCNCKRSKCLKLYCDCFAAGIYCAEPCACQECSNRPEYEDIVLETRRKIESRDPFAFAPKVVQGLIEQPAISYAEDGTHFTPASARHKKGCKCKKSMCLKKYCECYQSNVGCSDGCRCEGCKNIYGQKGEYGMTKVLLTGEDTYETTDSPFVEECETFASGKGTRHTDLVDPHGLTPLTPAVQFSNCGKDASKAWFPTGMYLQSPVSSFMHGAPYMMSPRLPQNSDDNETSTEILDQECRHDNADTVGEFSVAGHHQSGKMGHFFGIPNDHNSIAQPFSAKRNYSLVWRGSPITPIDQFSGSKALQEGVFDLDLGDIVLDDAAEMLDDSCTPPVKVSSSPNKKRVSPPHHGRRRPFELGSGSGSSGGGGIRTGRKYILKAVPSFPPLTPCIRFDASDVQPPDNRSANE